VPSRKSLSLSVHDWSRQTVRATGICSTPSIRTLKSLSCVIDHFPPARHSSGVLMNSDRVFTTGVKMFGLAPGRAVLRKGIAKGPEGVGHSGLVRSRAQWVTSVTTVSVMWSTTSHVLVMIAENASKAQPASHATNPKGSANSE